MVLKIVAVVAVLIDVALLLIPTEWSKLSILVALHPLLWREALTEPFRIAQPAWWRKWPPAPLPDPAYWRFRMDTAYGDKYHHMVADDVVHYMWWCRGIRLGQHH